jgi:hypothetical protein
MAHVTVDFDRVLGKIKPMHATGQPPFSGGFLSFDFSAMEYLQQAHMPYSRLHDVGGAFGGNRFVDIPNLFRDFDADENDPASYDFAFTDVLLEAMAKYDLKPIFRLGVTIENQAHIKAYRIHPPKDYGKWARICEHVIRHYNEGWANGFHYGIEYWEIWNEPDNGHTVETNQMWTGTAQQYYELYDVTARHLKACFGDSIKVGGYGACGMNGLFYHPEKYGLDIPKVEIDWRYEKDTYRVEFFLGFVEYIRTHNSPIDFFSWHCYKGVREAIAMDTFIHNVLSANGYGDLERQLNEWNNSTRAENHGKSHSSAAVAAMMCTMQHSHTDMLCYYDSRITASTYGGFFAPLTHKPLCTYYSFKAFGELYRIGTEAACSWDEKDLCVLAAVSDTEKAVLVVNFSENTHPVSMSIGDGFVAYRIDETSFMDPVNISPTAFTMEPNQVILFLK